MNLYVSKTNDYLNKKPLDTELISKKICLSPKYKSVTLKTKNVEILLDSGAFQDTEDNKRISYDDALFRQLKFENKLGIISQRIVAYDYINNVNETIKANLFLSSKRKELEPRQLVFMVQGKTSDEYLSCLISVLKIVTPADCIGFGGVAMAARNGEQKEKLLNVFKFGLHLIFDAGIRDIHIFGIGSFKLLEEINNILKTFDKNYFNVSTDTSAFEFRSVMGSVINLDTKRFEKLFSKEDKYIKYHPCDLTRENIKKAIKIIEGIT